MASSKLTIVNMALATLLKSPADSLETPSNAYERWAAALYEEALHTALVSWWWPEVRSRRVIGPSGKADDALEFGAGKRFALPGDCLKVHRVRNINGRPWTKEGRFIVVDTEESIWLSYYRQIKIDACGPLLSRLVAAQLAVDIARAVSDSQGALTNALKRYDYWYSRAAGSAAEEAGIESRRDGGSEQMAQAGVGYGRLGPVERSQG